MNKIRLFILLAGVLYSQIIKGTVTDTLYYPLSGITVEARNTFIPDSFYTDTSDTFGYFEIRVPEGFYELKFSGQNIIPFKKEGMIHVGVNDTIDLGMVVMYPFTSFDTLVVEVYGNDTLTPNPLYNSRIIIKSPFGFWERYTDVSGRAYFELFSNYTYSIHISKPGYISKDTFKSIIKGILDTLRIRLDTAISGLKGKIKGKVLDFFKQIPIDSAKVLLKNRVLDIPTIQLTTDIDGTFADSLAPGPYLVGAAKKGYLPQAYPGIITIYPGMITEEIKFYLTPLPPSAPVGTLNVIVSDSILGTPLSTTLLFIFDKVHRIGTSLFTNESGFARFELPADTFFYEALIFKNGYFKKKIFIGNIPSNSSKNVSIFLVPKFDPVLSRGIIDGHIKVNQRPAGDSRVILASLKKRVFKSITSDTGGYFKFINLPSDTYKLFIFARYAKPFDTLIVLNTPDDSVYIDVNLIENIKGRERFTGIVYDEFTSFPIENCLITAYDSLGNVFVSFTDSTGRFILDSLPSTHYILCARFPGYIAEFYENSYRLSSAKWVTPSANQFIVFSLIPAPDPQEGVIIRGNIVGFGTGTSSVKLLQSQETEAEVYLVDLTTGKIINSTKTDKKGNFVIMGAPPHTGHDWVVYSVSAGGEGYSPVFTFEDDTSGIVITTDIDERVIIPTPLKVLLYPTLFKDKINLDIRFNGKIKGELNLFDITGRKVKILKKGVFNGTKYILYPQTKSGIYIWIFKTDKGVYKGKIIKIK